MNPANTRSGVFLSYARADGEGFAHELRRTLEAQGISVWQDRTEMVGGRDWWLQIEAALGRVAFMVSVMTPRALQSETTQREWRLARREGVCVFPVKAGAQLDFGRLPRWMAKLHFYELRHEWEKFVADLQSGCRTARVPFMAEDLPADFVARPSEFQRLRESILSEADRKDPVAISAALRGAGGYGKTTLAAALCHDEEVQNVFDDGVLWVTLGQSPGDLTARVQELIRTLTGEPPAGFVSLEGATARLVELLADRQILIVIDDVWDAAHLRPFMQGGPRCARLVTTRSIDALPPGARTVDVDAMAHGEALALLGAGLPDGGRELARLAARLGEWPLLLKLANGALRERVVHARQPLAQAVEYFEHALTRRGLTFFDARNSSDRNAAVAKTLNVGLDLLTGDERARYAELAVFPEDVEVPLATVERLWKQTAGMDAFDTEELCDRLGRLSLLSRFDPVTRTIRLHDVVRAYLVHQSAAALPRLHDALLAAHRPPSPEDARWARLPHDEPYLWDWLAFHLAGAGREAELAETVKDLAFVAAKSFLRKTWAVEDDFAAAAAAAPGDPLLPRLHRAFLQAAHLLNRCDTLASVQATLHSRLAHAPGLSALVAAFEPELCRPRLAFSHRPPDLPHSALVRSFAGHDRHVYACCVSPDGSYAVSGAWGGAIKTWSLPDGVERRTLPGHEQSVFCCAVSGDGTSIVSASNDETVRVWNANTGEEELTLSGHTGPVYDCSVATDTFLIASASRREVILWNGATGRRLTTVPGRECCAIDPSGRFVAAPTPTGITFWSTDGGKEQFQLPLPPQRVNCCRISPDARTLAVGCDRGMMVLYDLESRSERVRMLHHKAVVRACAWSADAGSLVSSANDHTICVWNGATGELRTALYATETGVSACCLTPDGRLALSTNGPNLDLWDALQREEFVPTGHAEAVMSCAATRDGSRVVTSSFDETLKLWDTRAGREIRTFTGHAQSVHGCAITSDGGTVFSASSDDTVRAWDAATGKELRQLLRGSTLRDGFGLGPDDRTLAITSFDGFLVLVDVETGRVNHRVKVFEPPYSGNHCAFNPDGGMVAITSMGGVLRFHDTRTGAPMQVLPDPPRATSTAFSPSGEFIVTTSYKPELEAWDLATGRAIRTFAGHTDMVHACAVSPDSTLIASASEDGSLRVWEARTGACIAAIHVDGALADCRWLGGGDRLVAVGRGGVYFLHLVR
jgi:WD40 repeat protein